MTGVEWVPVALFCWAPPIAALCWFFHELGWPPP